MSIASNLRQIITDYTLLMAQNSFEAESELETFIANVKSRWADLTQETEEGKLQIIRSLADTIINGQFSSLIPSYVKESRLSHLMHEAVESLPLAEEFKGALLQFACLTDDRENIDKWLLAGASLTQFHNDMTPLHAAAAQGNHQAIALIIDHAIRQKMDRTVIDQKGPEGCAPIHLAVSSQSLNAVKILIDNKCNLDALDEENASPLAHAMSTQQKYALTKMLLEAGANAEMVDEEGFSLLWANICEKNADIVRLLLQFEANPNQILYSMESIEDAESHPLTQSLIMAYEDVIKFTKATLAYRARTISREKLEDKSDILCQSLNIVTALLKCPETDVTVSLKNGIKPLDVLVRFYLISQCQGLDTSWSLHLLDLIKNHPKYESQS